MAKKSSIEKNKRRERMAKRDLPKRTRLKAVIMDKTVSPEERFEASLKLAALPRNGAKIRVRNRCEITGRSHAVYRRFKLSRIMLRQMASEGLLPGVTKSSW
jgi:small subunit ribosomal protein S14